MIISLSFDPWVCFNQNLSDLPFLHKNDPKKEKSMVSDLHMLSRVSLAAKHRWTTSRTSRPLFVGSYLKVTWWALGQWEGRKVWLKWQTFYNNSKVCSSPLPIFCVPKSFKEWQLKFKGVRFELAQACTNQTPANQHKLWVSHDIPTWKCQMYKMV